MSGTWEGRSLDEIATSSQNDRYDVLAFGSPLTADMPSRRAPEQTPSAGMQGGEVRPVAQQNYTIGADGKIHGGRASYGPSGLAPNGDGGGVIVQAPPPQIYSNGQYVPAPGLYGGNRPGDGPQVPPAPAVNPNYYGNGWSPQIGNQIPDAPTRVPGTPAGGGSAVLTDARAGIIARSLYTQFNPDAYFGSAAIGGILGATYLPYLGDRFLKNDWWRNNYSPVQAEVDARTEKADVEKGKVQTARENYMIYNRERKADGQALEESTQKVSGAADEATIELQRMGHLSPTAAQGFDREVQNLNAQLKVLRSEPLTADKLEQIDQQFGKVIENAKPELQTDLTAARTALKTELSEALGPNGMGTVPPEKLDALATRTDPVIKSGRPEQRNETAYLAQNEKVKVFTAASDPHNINLNELKTRIYTKPEDINAGKFLSQEEYDTLQQHRNNYNEREIAINKMVGPTELDGSRNGGELSRYKAGREKLAGINKEIDALQNDPKAVKVGPLGGYTDRTGNVLGYKQINQDIAPETGFFKRLGGEWRAAGEEIKPGVETGRTTFKPFQAAGEGAMVAGVGLLADAIGDSFAGKHNYPDNAKIAQSLEGPLAAASFLFIKNPVAKLGGVAASVLGTKAIDWAMGGSNNATYSEILKPNWIEAGAMGAAWMLPARSPGARMAAVGLGWALGKGMNLAHMAGVPIWGIGDTAPGAKMLDNVNDSMIDFKGSPSFNNFKNLVSKSTDLAMENEGAIGARITTFTGDSSADQSPAKYETLAGLYVGMGNMWLARGSKIDPKDPKSHNDQGRFLPNAEIDLGGLGTSLYITARENLGMAANYVNKGGGTSADAQRIQQEQQAVQQQLDKVYGSHNIGQIYDRLLTDLKSKIGTTESQFSINQLTNFEINLKQRVQNPGVDEPAAARDPQFRAKLCRDLALVDLAIAQWSNEGGDGERSKLYYAQGVQALRMSTQFVRDSSDAQQLQQIADRVGPGVRPAIQQQYNSTFKNPFGIQPPGN